MRRTHLTTLSVLVALMVLFQAGWSDPSAPEGLSPQERSRLYKLTHALLSPKSEVRTSAYQEFRDAGAPGTQLLLEKLDPVRQVKRAAMLNLLKGLDKDLAPVQRSHKSVTVRREAILKLVTSDADVGDAIDDMMKSLAPVHHDYLKQMATARKRLDAIVVLSAWLNEIERVTGECNPEYESVDFALPGLAKVYPDHAEALEWVKLLETDRASRKLVAETEAANKERITRFCTRSEGDVIDMVNETRDILGRQTLLADELLVKAARKHSEEMINLGYFAHESPTAGLKTPSDRARTEGYPGSGVHENIAAGYGTARAVILAWWHSPPHRNNMLRVDVNDVGLGRKAGHWTMMLGAAKR